MGIYESGTPEQRKIRTAFRKMMRDNFAATEIRALAHIADCSMLPAGPLPDDPPTGRKASK